MPRIRLVPGGQTTTLSATSAWNVEASAATTKWIEYDDFKILLDADKQYGSHLTESGAALSIPDSTWTPITFDTETFDHNGYHSVATNTERITIPSGQKGVYMMGGAIAFVADNVGVRQVRLALNGSTAYLNTSTVHAPSATNTCRIHLSTIAVLDTADYVTIDGYQTSTGNLDCVSANMDFWVYMLTRIP